MRARIVTSIVLASVLGGCAAQHAQRPSALALSDCASLGAEQALAALPAKVQKVEPTYRREFLARAIQPIYVSGAALYVPAEPGVTSAYLERVLTCHAAAGPNLHANDPLRAEGVRSVSVSEAGPAMRITIVGADRKSGKAIYERARTLQAEGRVSVEQLSSAATQHARL